MKEQRPNPWMVSPRSLVKLLGAEYDIMQQAGAGVLGKFYLAALSIVVIIFLSFGSIWYAIDLLFRDPLAEIVLSVFFALLFACIYIFLINTFSKEYSPWKSRFFSLSNIIRTSFIVFIAYLVAQPLAIFAMGERLEQQTSQRKEQVLQTHLQTISAFYKNDLTYLQQRIQYCQEQKDIYGTHSFDTELAGLQTDITSIQDKETCMSGEARRKISGSSFFLYRIQMSTRYFQSWLLTSLVILLFLLPGYLIYSISSDNAYYTLKKDYEKNMIVHAYNAFTIQYKNIFQSEYGVAVELFSRFEDPPFKHTRKIDAAAGTMDAFLKKYITAD